MIFEPYAEVVREYWRLFLYYGGQVRATSRHIEQYGPYYPDISSCVLPEGFKVVYRMKQHLGKWYPTRSGLKTMLTNAIYLGHWMVNGVILFRNHHPAIIDEDMFMRAFHYLSDRGLDGQVNADYAPVRVNARPSKEEERNEPWPLCAGLIISQEEGGSWLDVGVRWNKARFTYFYVLKTKDESVPLGSKKAPLVDAAVAAALLDKLSATFDFDAWEQTVSELSDRYAQERLLLESQLRQLQTVMQNLVASLGTLQHPAMIRAAEKQYADAEAEMQRLNSLLESQAANSINAKEVRALKASCGDIFSNWHEMSPQEKRQVLHTFITRIEATLVVGVGLMLCIYWRDDSITTTQLPEMAADHIQWTEEEKQRLIALMASEAEQIEIAAAFPERTWVAICLFYRRVVKPGDRTKVKRKHVI